MGLDIEALKKKLAQVKEGNSGGGGADFWTPKDGRNVIRILPAAEGQEFYAESRVRYQVGPNNKMVTVPLNSSTANCPIHAYVDTLYKSKDPDDEKLAKRMSAKTRYYFNVIDRSVEPGQEGYGDVLVFGCGSTIFTDILSIVVDPDYGDITDPSEGYDIIITKSGKKLDTEYKTVARPKQTEIGIKDWKEKLNDLSKFASPKSYEEREAILNGDTPAKSEATTKAETKVEEAPAATKAETPASKAEVNVEAPSGVAESTDPDDIEAEIQRLLNEA